MCCTDGGEEECISDIGGKAGRKEITGKTKT
jgi:23S rRNA C2498 (ribose-2'-O)-methylase RlmM